MKTKTTISSNNPRQLAFTVNKKTVAKYTIIQGVIHIKFALPIKFKSNDWYNSLADLSIPVSCVDWPSSTERLKATIVNVDGCA
jgi:hypothetical protein